jgi:hypothetical protein
MKSSHGGSAFLLAAGVAVVGASCGDLPHQNIYDPGYSIQMTLTGPDASSSLGDTVEFSLTTTPEWKGTAPEWRAVGDLDHTVSLSTNLRSLGGGRFVVLGASYAGTPDAVEVKVGPHLVTHRIVLEQKVASIHFVPRLDTAFTTAVSSYHFIARGEEQAVDALAYDARNNRVYAPLDLVSRDPAVVDVVMNESGGGAVGRSASNGSTWLVASLDGAVDSVMVSVLQRPAHVTCSPSSPISLATGDSVQLHVSAWTDTHEQPLDSLPRFQWYMNSRADDEFAPGTSLEVTPSGMVYANRNPNSGVVGLLWRWPDGSDSGKFLPCEVTTSTR